MLERNPLRAAALLREVAERLAAMEMPALEGHVRALLCGALLSAGHIAAAREAAALALPLVTRSGNPGPLLEHEGPIAALDGCPHEAAQLLGFLGEQRRDGGVIRPPANERLAKDAQAAIDRALGRAEQRRLGQAGAGLGMEQIAALASAVLA